MKLDVFMLDFVQASVQKFHEINYGNRKKIIGQDLAYCCLWLQWSHGVNEMRYQLPKSHLLIAYVLMILHLCGMRKTSGRFHPFGSVPVRCAVFIYKKYRKKNSYILELYIY